MPICVLCLRPFNSCYKYAIAGLYCNLKHSFIFVLFCFSHLDLVLITVFFSLFRSYIMEAIAKHDFVASADDELSFTRNSKLKVCWLVSIFSEIIEQWFLRKLLQGLVQIQQNLQFFRYPTVVLFKMQFKVYPHFKICQDLNVEDNAKCVTPCCEMDSEMSVLPYAWFWLVWSLFVSC